MKKVIFLLTFLFALGLTATNAQSCCANGNVKSCCVAKAQKAAAADPNIEQRKADDGSVCFVRKETDATGNVKFVNLSFDEATGSFVNMAPKGMTDADKSACTKKPASCSAGEKKACCKEGAAKGKACCAAKAKE